MTDEDWEEGAAAVAARIREIEAEFSQDLPRPEDMPELERSKLLEHVRRLLTAPETAALNAEGAADVLERAIKTYLYTAPAECLPDELLHVNELPALFRSISKTVRGHLRAEAKERQLVERIEKSNLKVAQLEAALKAARSKTVHGLFTQGAWQGAGMAFGSGVIGTLGLATAHFFGHWPEDFTFENFRGYLSDLGAATPKVDARPTLPPIADL